MSDTTDLRVEIASRLDDVLVDGSIPELPGLIRGKVRDNYDLPDDRRLLIATDRQSAFDQILAAVPFKGQVLTATSRYWFEATADIAANHVLAYPDANVTVARRLAMLPVEIVVRDFLTGTTATSLWPRYAEGERVLYGIRFPDGLQKNERLPRTVITPTTKGADGGHDEPIAPLDIVGRGLMSSDHWQQTELLALALFERGRKLAAERGLILVDTKYEFGLDLLGNILVADEIHTPDSSRFWLADSYPQRLGRGEEPEALDKDFLRRWIVLRCDPYRQPIPPIPEETIVEFGQRYIRLYEIITGQRFVPAAVGEPIAKRIRRNVLTYLNRHPSDIGNEC